MDKREWVGGLKFAIFVHVSYIKSVHGGRWVVSQMSTFVHVRWVGGLSNVHVDMLST